MKVFSTEINGTSTFTDDKLDIMKEVRFGVGGADLKNNRFDKDDISSIRLS